MYLPRVIVIFVVLFCVVCTFLILPPAMTTRGVVPPSLQSSSPETLPVEAVHASLSRSSSLTWRNCFSGIIALKPLSQSPDKKQLCSTDPLQQQIITLREHECSSIQNLEKDQNLGDCHFAFVGVEFARNKSRAFRCSSKARTDARNAISPLGSGMWVWLWLARGCHNNGPWRSNGLGRTDAFWNDEYVLDATASNGHFGGYEPKWELKKPSSAHSQALVFAARSGYRGFQHFILDPSAWLVASHRVLAPYEPWDYIHPTPLDIEEKLLKILRIPVPPVKQYIDGLVCSKKGIFVPLQMRQLQQAPETFDIVQQRFGEYPLPQQPPAVVFLSRDNAGRDIVNVDEAKEVLQTFIKANRPDLRFVEFRASQNTLEQTMALMRSAVLFVGSHGGAFANIIFGPPQAGVIEFCGYMDPTAEVWKSYWYYGWCSLRHICVQKAPDRKSPRINLNDFRAALQLWHTGQQHPLCYSAFNPQTGEVLVQVEHPIHIDFVRKFEQYRVRN